MGNTHTSDEDAAVRKTACIWRLFTGAYKVYVEDKCLKDELVSWQGCKLHCVYFNRRFQVVGWDLVFPARLYNRVARLCGLPRKKRPSRSAGMEASVRDARGLEV